MYYINLYQEWIGPSTSNKFLKNTSSKFLPTAKSSQFCFCGNPDLASNSSKVKSNGILQRNWSIQVWIGWKDLWPWGWPETLRPIATGFEVAWLVELKSQQEGRGQSRRKKKKHIFITFNWWVSVVREKLSQFLGKLTSHFP